MKKQYHREEERTEAELTIRLSREEMERLINEELHRSALSVGVMVISELIEQEVNDLCGARRKRNPGRKGYRYGMQEGTSCWAVRKCGSTSRAFARSTAGAKCRWRSTGGCSKPM